MRKNKKGIEEELPDDHHCDPTSRGGADEEYNKKKKIVKIHRNFHRLFENLKPAEIILMIFSIKFCCELKDLSDQTAIQEKVIELKKFFSRKSIRRLFRGKILEEVVKNIFIRDKKGGFNSWEIVFGDKTLTQIIEEIEKEWSPDPPNSNRNNNAQDK